jgi:hypothetical protein
VRPLRRCAAALRSSQALPLRGRGRALTGRARRSVLAKREKEEKELERVREKERVRAGKELLAAKRVEEDQERRRNIEWRKREKEEEAKAREKIRLKLLEDKRERRRKLGLPEDPTPEELAAEEAKAAAKAAEEAARKAAFAPAVRPVSAAEKLRAELVAMKRAHAAEEGRFTTAARTLLTYCGNIAGAPAEDKFRRIRLANDAFQQRVGAVTGGLRFLELLGFERDEQARAGRIAAAAHSLADVAVCCCVRAGRVPHHACGQGERAAAERGGRGAEQRAEQPLLRRAVRRRAARGGRRAGTNCCAASAGVWVARCQLPCASVARVAAAVCVPRGSARRACVRPAGGSRLGAAQHAVHLACGRRGGGSARVRRSWHHAARLRRRLGGTHGSTGAAARTALRGAVCSRQRSCHGAAHPPWRCAHRVLHHAPAWPAGTRPSFRLPQNTPSLRCRSASMASSASAPG